MSCAASTGTTRFAAICDQLAGGVIPSTWAACDRVLERAHRADVRVDLVVDVRVLLVGPGDAVDVVLAVAAERRPRRPERRRAGQHRPALLLEPVLVRGDEVVLPLRERDVGGDVLLVQALAVDRGRWRDLLGAVERALPREAGAGVAGRGRVLLGLAEPLEAVRVHPGGEVGVLREQRRVHPRLGVPEDVAVVAVGRQPRRRHAPVDAVARARPQVELAGVDVGRERGVAAHLDPAAPQRGPRRIVGAEQRVPAGVRPRPRPAPWAAVVVSAAFCELSMPTYLVIV